MIDDIVGCGERGLRELGPAERARRNANHADVAGINVHHDVLHARLEEVSGEALGLVDHRLGRVEYRGAAELQRAGPTRATAAADEVGVALHETDLVHRDAGL
ncbi:unannotated protein [freshwater metagenome]|uniref:Unannotated protein n=1 Tax=freshwater metagenome TaxID=449393 RepID=A0A6J7EN00_9ZZZZ